MSGDYHADHAAGRLPWQCGERTPRMKGPCVLMRNHADHPMWRSHRSYSPDDNEDTPKLREFARIVNAGLDDGIQLTYAEVATIMGHPNPRGVTMYGPGARYTRLRQKIYHERGVVASRKRGTPQQQLVRELKLRGAF